MEVRGEAISAGGELLQKRGHSLDQPSLLGREEDAAGPDNAQTSTPRDGSATPFVEEDESAGPLLGKENGLGLSWVEHQAQSRPIFSGLNRGGDQPALFDSFEEQPRPRPAGIELKLFEDSEGDQDLLVEVAKQVEGSDARHPDQRAGIGDNGRARHRAFSTSSASSSGE